ncbi:MAG: hypothetical protein ACRDHL_15695 [Candidatus Promineifilaceae bacterium]
MTNSTLPWQDLNSGTFDLGRLAEKGTNLPRQLVIGLILILALVAFELFNFDTTRYALRSLLGEVRFAGFTWAGILALAFCAIDFAGLARLFTPERGRQVSKEVWYLTGAWLLGATMNAVMTWWAVSLTLLSHDLGNEVLTRAQLLKVVPVFIAILVWLTRILFIGAVTVAGERLLHASGLRERRPEMAAKPIQPRPAVQPVEVRGHATRPAQPAPKPDAPSLAPKTQPNARVRQRPPRPGVQAAQANGPASSRYNGAQIRRPGRSG